MSRYITFVGPTLAVAAIATLTLTNCQTPAPQQQVQACGGECKDGQACVNEKCVDTICEAHQATCIDSRTVSICNGNGTDQLIEECPENKACLQGSCVQTICVPNGHYCGWDGVRMLCNADGLGSEEDPCETGKGCSGVGECVPQICTPHAVTCVTEGEAAVTRCNPSGTEWGDGECQHPAPVCVADLCQSIICNPGETACKDATTQAECNTTGTGFINENPCNAAAGEVCQPDVGECATACEIAALTSSYIGCDYRMAITDNLLDEQLGTGSDPFPAAVVVTNGYDSNAQITLRDPSGSPLTLGPAKHVTDRQPSTIPDQDVHSKVTAGSAVTNIDGQTIDGFVLEPGAVATFLLPIDIVKGSGIFNKGYHLSSTLPVSAYLFNPICCNFAYSNDASLLIPTTAWRTAYFAMSTPHKTWAPTMLGWQQSEMAGAPSGFAVLAQEDNTRIAVRKRAGQPDSDFLIENGLPNFGNDSAYPEELRVTINAGDVFQLETAYKTSAPDVTGVLVASDKPIGVFGIHECAYIPEKGEACDHMEEMLLPIETWGKEYLAAMPKMRNTNIADAENKERMYYRFISSADANRIQLTPKPGDIHPAHAASTTTCPVASDGTFVLSEGDYCEIASRDNFKIIADEPIMVGAIFAGQEATGMNTFGQHGGDPALSQLVPIDQFRKDYSFLTPDTYYADYVTIVFKSASVIELDGVQITNPTTAGPIGTNELVDTATPIIDNYMRMTIKLSRGAHTLKSFATGSTTIKGDGFGIFNYGYDDYVSYGYPGGLDLRQTSTYPNIPAFP